MSQSFLLAATLLLPLVGSLFIALTGSRPNLREAVTMVTSVLLAAIVYSLLQDVLAGARPSAPLAERGAHTRVGFEGSEGEAVSYERVEGRVVGAELEMQHEGRFRVDGTTALSGRRAPAEFIELPAFDSPVDA